MNQNETYVVDEIGTRDHCSKLKKLEIAIMSPEELAVSKEIRHGGGQMEP